MTRSVPHALVWILGWMVMCSAATAAAQPDATPAQPDAMSALSHDDEARPWARDVPEAEQAIARELYAQGNAEFAESRFAQALANYREALRHWDHPAIRFNMAVCLINLGKLLDARDNLERSLAYRTAPLGSASYAQALAYRTLLDGQLAHVQVRCTEPGAVVTLDGKYLFTGPGSAQQHVLPGEHQIAATKAGLPVTTSTVVLAAGQLVVQDIQLSRWATWKPWALIGGGVTAVSLGVVMASYAFAARSRAGLMSAPPLAMAGAFAIKAGVNGLAKNLPRLQIQPLPSLSVEIFPRGGAMLSTGWTF